MKNEIHYPNAKYKGIWVFVGKKHQGHFLVFAMNTSQVVPENLLIDMELLSRGEYFGKIREGDPDLIFQDCNKDRTRTVDITPES